VKNYFSFTRSQQVGVAFWALLILGLIFTSSFLPESPEGKFEVNPEDLEYIQINAQSNQKYYSNNYNSTVNKSTISLSDFDPNILDFEGWKNLGFSEKQVNAIINYRDRFGPFKRKEDLKNIFVISEDKYRELEPFIKIELAQQTETKVELISLNSASVAELESLPGVGPKFAERILKFRNSLGGFSSMTQLHEVYNMTEEIYQILADETFINSNEIVQIKINSASKDEIDKHPYIDFDATAAILKERESKKIENLDFLISKNLMTPEEKERLEPYISFE
jgi:DNA uptake protein ComE-like DNA-binding protein